MKASHLKSQSNLRGVVAAVLLAALATACGGGEAVKPDQPETSQPAAMSAEEQTVDGNISTARGKLAALPDEQKSSRRGQSAGEYLDLAARLLAKHKTDKANDALDKANKIIATLGKDTDKDGVADNVDKCPDKASSASDALAAIGCPDSEAGFATINAVDATGNALSGATFDGFNEVFVLRGDGAPAMAAGLPGSYPVTVSANGMMRKLAVRLKKQSRTYLAVKLGGGAAAAPPATPAAAAPEAKTPEATPAAAAPEAKTPEAKPADAKPAEKKSMEEEAPPPGM